MAKTDDTNKQDHKINASEAGRKGGEATSEKGSAFYSEIGSQQGKENNPGNFANRDDASEAGRKGGQARQSGNHDDK